MYLMTKQNTYNKNPTTVPVYIIIIMIVIITCRINTQFTYSNTILSHTIRIQCTHTQYAHVNIIHT